MKTSEASKFLDQLNTNYTKLHKVYEDLFWVSYMGDHSVDKKKDQAMAKRDTFRADPKFIKKIDELLPQATAEEKTRLGQWRRFFECYQSPKKALPIKNKISRLETKLLERRAKRKEGYIDPKTSTFVPTSALKMATMMSTHDDESIRKACFDAREKLAIEFINEYVEIVKLRNEYARILGYEDFYAFKVEREDGMTKKELFKIFDDIYERTKYAKEDIKKLEEKMPGLRKPWNFGYMMAGDFTKEEDQFFQFDEALERWGRSFAALGVNFKGGKLQLDLLDRKGKWNNGFCHWPDLVTFKNGKRRSGSSNFTCNVVFGQVGAGFEGIHTLFHEGGHSAHMLNAEQLDVCINHEYAPMSMAWAETQSMFMDSMFNSVEWRNRYAKNAKGESYSFDLFERKVRKMNLLRPLGLNHIMLVSNFEKEIYETKNLTSQKVKDIARVNFRKYYERSEDAVSVLNVPHIYSWESSGSYHGYGLADIAVEQWREYFYKKYGYIVDNPNVGKEMTKMWTLAASKTFKEFVIEATGEALSPKAIIVDMTMSIDAILSRAKERISRLKKVKAHIGPIQLGAKIKMVSGKKTIAADTRGFEHMANQYKAWLQKNKTA